MNEVRKRGAGSVLGALRSNGRESIQPTDQNEKSPTDPTFALPHTLPHASNRVLAQLAAVYGL